MLSMSTRKPPPEPVSPLQSDNKTRDEMHRVTTRLCKSTMKDFFSFLTHFKTHTHSSTIHIHTKEHIRRGSYLNNKTLTLQQTSTLNSFIKRPCNTIETSDLRLLKLVTRDEEATLSFHKAALFNSYVEPVSNPQPYIFY